MKKSRSLYINHAADFTDDDIDSISNVHELNFSNDEPTPSFADLDPEFEKALDRTLGQFKNNSLTDALPGGEPTENDLAPEILIKEDGARSPYETGSNKAADQNLTIVDEHEIGGGNGLDEAELARKKPLDGKRWDEHSDKSDA